MMPALTMSTVSPLRASNPWPLLPFATWATAAALSRPLLATMQENGWLSERCTSSAPCLAAPFSFLIRASSSGATRIKATPPPGTMPSSIAARVALIESSINCALRFCSTGVAPPARIIAVPPDSFARRSWNLSPPPIFRPRIELARHLLAPSLNLLWLPVTRRDQRLSRRNSHLTRRAEILQPRALYRAAKVLRYHLAACRDGDVVQHRLAPMAVFRRMNRGHLEVIFLTPRQQHHDHRRRHFLRNDQ